MCARGEKGSDFVGNNTKKGEGMCGLPTANGQLAKYPPVVTSKYERSPLYLQCRIYGCGQYHGDISSQGVVDMTGMNGGCRYHDYRISRIT